MPFQFHYQRRVEFHETDLAGIVHFSNYFRYMEAAEHAFLRSLGLAVHGEYDGQEISFPRVKAECAFLSPLRFEEVVDVHVVVKAVRRSAITYGFVIACAGSSQPAGRGSMTAVCVTFDAETRQMRAATIPAAITRQIKAAPREMIEQLFPGEPVESARE